MNYERTIFNKNRFQTSGQIGVAYYGIESGVVPLWVPISHNQTFSFANGKFVEIGAGKMFRNDGWVSSDGTFHDNYQFEEWIFRLGYKQVSKNDKWVFKIAYTPIYQDKSEFIHWGGISFGRRI